MNDKNISLQIILSQYYVLTFLLRDKNLKMYTILLTLLIVLNFREANKVFEERIKYLETLQIRPTKEPISGDDLNRIVNFDIFSNKQPEFLQLKVSDCFLKLHLILVFALIY